MNKKYELKTFAGQSIDLEDYVIIFINKNGQKDFFMNGNPGVSQNQIWRLINQ